jgi:hypothetical protein
MDREEHSAAESRTDRAVLALLRQAGLDQQLVGKSQLPHLGEERGAPGREAQSPLAGLLVGHLAQDQVLARGFPFLALAELTGEPLCATATALKSGSSGSGPARCVVSE